MAAPRITIPDTTNLEEMAAPRITIPDTTNLEESLKHTLEFSETLHGFSENLKSIGNKGISGLKTWLEDERPFQKLRVEGKTILRSNESVVGHWKDYISEMELGADGAFAILTCRANGQLNQIILPVFNRLLTTAYGLRNAVFGLEELFIAVNPHLNSIREALSGNLSLKTRLSPDLNEVSTPKSQDSLTTIPFWFDIIPAYRYNRDDEEELLKYYYNYASDTDDESSNSSDGLHSDPRPYEPTDDTDISQLDGFAALIETMLDKAGERVQVVKQIVDANILPGSRGISPVTGVKITQEINMFRNSPEINGQIDTLSQRIKEFGKDFEDCQYKLGILKRLFCAEYKICLGLYKYCQPPKFCLTRE